MKAIDDAGIADNTIVIFAGDNGHSHYTGWDKLVKAGISRADLTAAPKATFGKAAIACRSSFAGRGTSRPGSSSDQLLCLNDLFATCAELSGR